jgi:AcrR family transcriptional regulator
VDPIETRILDAALDAVAAGSATMDAIAERAGVGRVTLFRRFGSKEGLLQRLYHREVARFLMEVDAALMKIDDPAERVAVAFAACVRAGAGHPLVARLRRGEALEYLAAGDPSPLDLGRRFVAERLDPGQEHIADLLVRLAVTYVLVPSADVDVADQRSARTFARRMLAPLVTASATSGPRAG